MSRPSDPTTPDEMVRADDTLDGGAILRLLDRPLAADDLLAATDRVARPLEPPEKQVVRVVLFRLGDELLSLEAIHVVRVTHSTAVRRIPHRSNKIIRGLCNIDGELVLCADLGRLLELNKTGDGADASSRRMLVIGTEDNRWAMEVDAVDGVMSVVPETFRQLPITVEEALGRCANNLIPLDDGSLASLLNHERLTIALQAALA